MARVNDLIRVMNSLAPEYLAEEWDNVGLIAGDPDAPLRGPVLLTIDLRDAVVDEASLLQSSAVVVYHPPIFHPTRRLVATDPRQRVVLRALASGLAIYSPHTALDAAQGGLCDWLADVVLAPQPGQPPEAADRRALRPAGFRPPTQQVKIVTFVPERALDEVRHALASAGAGLIGQYSVCSFATTGVGTFLGSEHTRPAVGRPQQLETVPEHRLEMVCSKRALALALTTLRQFHPYEEPAIDVYELMPQPDRAAGTGRRLVLDRPLPLAQIAARIKANLRLSVVGVGDAGTDPVRTIGLCPGAGASLIDAAIAEGCQVFITGELSHHDALRAMDRGMSVITAGHTSTERGYLPILAERLGTVLGHPVRVSASDRDPITPL